MTYNLYARLHNEQVSKCPDETQRPCCHSPPSLTRVCDVVTQTRDVLPQRIEQDTSPADSPPAAAVCLVVAMHRKVHSQLDLPSRPTVQGQQHGPDYGAWCWRRLFRQGQAIWKSKT